jgi:hypothetical protein
MKIIVYKNDKNRLPYLVHEQKEQQLSLGLYEYPDTEQDDFISIDRVEFLKGKEYQKAKEFILKIM